MPLCSGRWPHLRKYDLRELQESCPCYCVRGKQICWFPATLGVLSIPSTTDHLHQLVKDSWNVLRVVTSPEILVALRRLGQIQGELAQLS
jgi:hypothetical protein